MTTYNASEIDRLVREGTDVYSRNRPGLVADMVAALSAAKAEVERLTNALTKISAIRDSIVGCQGFNFSEHAYPLVTVLDAAGFKGAGYEIASKNLGTLIERATKAEAENDRLAAEVERWRKLEFASNEMIALNDRLSARVRELELTEEERGAIGSLVKSFSGSIVLSRSEKVCALAVLDRLTGRSKP